MTIKGLGVDIEDIASFKKLDFKNNKKFYKKIFTKKEIEYCLQKHNPYQHFAARFCAKEAFVKAINKKLDYKDIEISFDKEKPTIRFPGLKVFLSMSHDNNKAVASVVIESKK